LLSANKRHVRVLLVEQSAADAELIVQELREAGMQVTTERVDSARELPSMLREFAPDVVLVEHLLPGLDFKSIVATVQDLRPRTPVIVVSGILKSTDAGYFVRAGAETFISKTNLPRLAPAIAAAMDARSPLEKLTPRQIEVMRLVAVGLRTRDIAERLKLSVKTIESHRQEVMRRLELRNMADLVRYAVRVGLVGER
jgi:DNA-binding NarL/FixJ family response regulator